MTGTDPCQHFLADLTDKPSRSVDTGQLLRRPQGLPLTHKAMRNDVLTSVRRMDRLMLADVRLKLVTHAQYGLSLPF